MIPPPITTTSGLFVTSYPCAAAVRSSTLPRRRSVGYGWTNQKTADLVVCLNQVPDRSYCGSDGRPKPTTRRTRSSCRDREAVLGDPRSRDGPREYRR